MIMSLSADKFTIEPLDVDNYATWSLRVMMLLKHKGLWSTIERAKDATVDPGTDQKALSLICLHVQDHHLVTLAMSPTAKAAWESLQQVYKAKSNARSLQLRRELYSLKMAPNEPLTKFVARAKMLRDNLLAAGQDIKSSEIAWAVLNGLPDAYKPIVTVLTASDNELEIDSVLPKLMMAEASVLPEIQHDNAVALSATSARKPTRTCYYCGKEGHVKANCFKRQRDEELKTGGSKTGGYKTLSL